MYYLAHEEKAEYGSWIKILFTVLPAALIGLAIYLAFTDLAATATILGEAVLLGLIFHSLMPRRYQIYQDHLRIVLGRPFGINIPFSTIKEARRASGSTAMVYFGIRFATSTRFVVEITRTRGISYVISPQNGDLFLEQLNQALKMWGR